MKLRNKKTGLTGKLIDIDLDIYEDGAEIYISILLDNSGGECIDKQFHSIDELKKFFEEWEDYKPAEPYIKDEKIRKFVRDWAEINGIKKVLVCESFHSWGFTNKNDCKPSDKEYMGADLLFRGEKPEELDFGKEYTIPELCGEEG